MARLVMSSDDGGHMGSNLGSPFAGRHVSQMVQSLGSLVYEDDDDDAPSFFGFNFDVRQQSTARGGGLVLDAQAVANVLHGHAMAGVYHAWALELLLDKLPLLLDSKGRDVNLMQAFQYMLMLEAKGFLSPSVRNSNSYQEARTRCREAWLVGREQVAPSPVQLDVLAAVRKLPGCAGAVGEQLTEDGLFNVDVGVELPGGVKLAIEVDGPHHFMSNEPEMATGATTLRNLLLEARGWRVVSVPVGPHAPWERLGAKGREAYLRSLIAPRANRA
jgi:hypothetical protein